ncbi:MAG TPA: transposase, partial [Acidimicrobiales bacterium]
GVLVFSWTPHLVIATSDNATTNGALTHHHGQWRFSGRCWSLNASPYNRTVGKEMTAHHVVNHNIGQYVTDFSDGTNKAENFFSQLKRSISGTHHSLRPEHLHRYLAEFAFRHGSHDLTDTERMVKLMSQIPGRRLSYRPLTGTP